MALQLYLTGLSVQREGCREDDFLAELILQDWKQRLLKNDNAYYCYYWITRQKTSFIVTDVEIYDCLRHPDETLEEKLRGCSVQRFEAADQNSLETEQLKESGFYPAYRLLRKMQANINRLNVMQMPQLIDPEAGEKQ